MGEGVQGPHPHAKFHRCGLKMSAYSPQNREKMVIFGTNLSLRENSGATEKVEYRCTTTNLPVCNDTIIVLKITLHHGVSFITNFVIPKRDKNRQKTSHFFVYSRRAIHDPHHTQRSDRGGPCHFCTPSPPPKKK